MADDRIDFNKWNTELAGQHAVADDLGFEPKPAPVTRMTEATALGMWMLYRRKSLQDVAIESGLPIQTIVWLMGTGGEPKLDVVIKLARGFGVGIRQFMAGPPSVAKDIAERPTTAVQFPLREWRLLHGYTQSALAMRVDVRAQLIDRIEKGGGMPGTDVLTRLANAFGTTIEGLLAGPKEAS